MPELLHKTLHSFSSEDSQFPAKNLLETKVTKKYKCKNVGERSCFVVLKLDQPRIISGIDIGNEDSGCIEVLIGNSKQDPPVFKEILLMTSFMTIVEAKNGKNPNRVRCFASSALVESVARHEWDLVKIVCTQPFNSRLQYGLAFVTLHTPQTEDDDLSPKKSVPALKPAKVENSGEKKKTFGKFELRPDSDSEDAKKSSPFDRWKSSKTDNPQQTSIKEQMKAKLEQNRKRIRLMDDSSDDEKPKAKTKPNRNRTSGLVYEDEDDEPNERLQKKLDKDKETREKEQKTPKPIVKRDKSPPSSDQKKNKFSSFISDEPKPSSSSHNRPSFSSSISSGSKHSTAKHSSSTSKHSPSSRSKSSSSKSVKIPEKKRTDAPPKNVTYKPFHKLLEGVTFVLSGYQGTERHSLRQKALDMGAKYKPDWDSSCTHLICAVNNTPKYKQVKGEGKIVKHRWIEACFKEQKKLPWRRYALDNDDKDEPESEEEIHNILKKPKSPTSKKLQMSDSDDDMVVVDKRVKNGDAKKDSPPKPVVVVDEDPVKIVEKTPESIEIDDEPVKIIEGEPNNNKASSQNIMEVSTDDELMNASSKASTIDLTEYENQIYKEKSFFLMEDLPATDVIKLKNQITAMMGKVTEKPHKADFIITKTGRRLPSSAKGEALTPLWIYECYELGAFIPTTRYKPK